VSVRNAVGRTSILDRGQFSGQRIESYDVAVCQATTPGCGTTVTTTSRKTSLWKPASTNLLVSESLISPIFSFYSLAKGRIPRHRHRHPREDVGVSGESARMSVSWNAALTHAAEQIAVAVMSHRCMFSWNMAYFSLVRALIITSKRHIRSLRSPI